MSEAFHLYYESTTYKNQVKNTRNVMGKNLKQVKTSDHNIRKNNNRPNH